MQRELSTITLDDREEVRDLIAALISWVEDHEGEQPTKTVRQLLAYLDVMDMEW